MSQSAAYSFSDAPVSLSTEIASFFRRWFASETIANPHALDEIGLGHIFTRSN